jgi:hypothetical protein
VVTPSRRELSLAVPTTRVSLLLGPLPPQTSSCLSWGVSSISVYVLVEASGDKKGGDSGGEKVKADEYIF